MITIEESFLEEPSLFTLLGGTLVGGRVFTVWILFAGGFLPRDVNLRSTLQVHSAHIRALRRCFTGSCCKVRLAQHLKPQTLDSPEAHTLNWPITPETLMC